MKRQLSVLDVVRFAISFIVFWLVLIMVDSRGAYVMQGDSGEALYLLSLFFRDFLPIFLAILVGLILLSWRFKLVGGMLFLSFGLILSLFDLPKAMTNWIVFLYYMVKVSMFMIGGGLAIIIWSKLKDKFYPKKVKVNTEIGKKMVKPKTSLILIILSLLSVPLTYIVMLCSAFITLGFSSLVLYLVMKLPRIPVAVIIAGFLAPLIGIWAGIRALWTMFFPSPQFEPATILDISKFPVLKKTIDNVCQKVKTRRPSVVILHSEPTFFVLQGKLNTFDGVVKGRILAIGLPILRELKYSELSSVLAHEFAHFSGRDTAYSTIVSPVYRGIIASMNEISEGGKGDNNTTNLMGFLLLPSQIFLGLFLQYFATIEKILSRSRELRADWIAAQLFGANNFSSALTKVTMIGQHFNENYENLALNSEKDLFDKHSQLLQQNSSKLEEYRAKAYSLQEDDFDSHPSFSTRLMSLPDNVAGESDLSEEAQNINLELLDKGRELSQKYTGRIKKIKEFFDQYQKMLEGIKKKEELKVLNKDKILKVSVINGYWVCPTCSENNKELQDVCSNCGQEIEKEHK